MVINPRDFLMHYRGTGADRGVTRVKSEPVEFRPIEGYSFSSTPVERLNRGKVGMDALFSPLRGRVMI